MIGRFEGVHNNENSIRIGPSPNQPKGFFKSSDLTPKLFMALVCGEPGQPRCEFEAN
jgi:hypothetical protein